MRLALTGLPLPLRLRTDTPLSNLELERLSNDNNPLRIEREPNGELIVMSSTGSEGGSQELEVATELVIWARLDGRGKAFGPNAGFTLPDNSVRAADAAWVSFSRWNALTSDQRKGFAPFAPNSSSKFARTPTASRLFGQRSSNGSPMGPNSPG